MQPSEPKANCLTERTRYHLKQRVKETSILAVHIETGLPFYWLRKFVQGETKDPACSRVQELYEKLTGHELELK